MSIVTLRPNATRYCDMSIDVAGGGTAHGATNDNSDATAISFPANLYTTATLDFGTTVIPAGAFVKAVRQKIRYSTIGGNVVGWFSALLGTSASDYVDVLGHNDALAARTTQTFGWVLQSPSGLPWTQADIDAIAMWLWVGYYQGTIPNLGLASITELYIDVDINYNPTTSVTGPATTVTTTTKPIVTYTYADTDGDPMEAYQVKVFDSATYGAGGFNVWTSPTVWDSGRVFASSPVPVTIGVDLNQGGTYRAYVVVYQANSGSSGPGNGISDGTQYRQFTINVTPPAVPTIVADYVTFGGINKARVVLTANDALTTSVDILETADNGVTWRAPRYLQGVPLTNASPKALYDQEAPVNIPLKYRARSAYTSGGSRITSAWSALTSAVTVALQDWVLRSTSDVNYDGIKLNVVGPNPFSEKNPQDKAFFNPQGRARKVSVSDTIKGAEAEMLLEFLTEADYQAFEALRNKRETLLLFRGWTSERWFIQLQEVREMLLFNYNPIYRQVKIGWIEVDAPPV